MVARAMEKRDTERDASPEAKAAEGPLSPRSEAAGLSQPDPAKDPQWQGISGDMAKEFGEADPSSPAPRLSGRAYTAVDEPPIKLAIKVDTPTRPSLEEALRPVVDSKNNGLGNDSTAAATLEQLKKQMEALQALLKQEHDERLTTEAIVKDLSLDNRNLRDELAKATLAAATSKAALEAREELLQHLKAEVVELRAVALKLRA